jgi:molecular chaperone GrpE (heat shock protein)
VTHPNPTIDDIPAEAASPPAELSEVDGVPPETTDVPEAPPADPVAEALRLVRDELAGQNERAAARERVIDRLHDENQQLKAGERQNLLRPVITDLYRLRDDLLKQAGELPGDFDAVRAAALLRSYAQSVEMALERAGVLPVTPEIGAAFDARQHRASGVVPAAGPAADATVAEVVRDGYRDTVSDRVLMPATVRVARWTAEPGEPA